MKRVLTYNPSFLTPDERVAQFVAREEELRTILRAIEGNTGPSHQHLLVLGARGLGKSTLVQRVVAEVVRTDLGKTWYPLVFPEEPYEAADIGEFWLEALYRLADQTHDPRWHELHQRLRRERDPARLAALARSAIKAHASEIGRNILLVVENLDMLFDQLTDPDAWALRATLQSDPTFMLLATALRPFEAITDHAKPFYEGFRRIELRALSAEEIEKIWALVTGHRPGRARAQAVRVLTGGNPRMVALLAQLADGRTLREILGELARLIDAHTDYFKSNIEALDGQNRRVFLALATLWHPATAGQIAEEARLEGNVVSTLLGRLERQGRIEVVGKKGKNRLYQLSERLYNIYYLMRRRGTDARYQALIAFMVLFYEPCELSELMERLAQGPDPDARREDRPLEAALARGKIAEAIALAKDLAARPSASALAWRVLAEHAPAEALAAWRSRADWALPDTLAFAIGAVHAVDRRVWETALEAASRFDNDNPTLLVALTLLEGLCGRPDRALERFGALAAQSDAGPEVRGAMLSLAFALAASGQAFALARTLAASPQGAAFRPLVAALDGSLLSEVSAEERAIAEDITARVRALGEERNVWVAVLSPSAAIAPKERRAKRAKPIPPKDPTPPEEIGAPTPARSRSG